MKTVIPLSADLCGGIVPGSFKRWWVSIVVRASDRYMGNLAEYPQNQSIWLIWLQYIHQNILEKGLASQSYSKTYNESQILQCFFLDVLPLSIVLESETRWTMCHFWHLTNEELLETSPPNSVLRITLYITCTGTCCTLHLYTQVS